jgi:hypothetical protein
MPQENGIDQHGHAAGPERPDGPADRDDPDGQADPADPADPAAALFTERGRDLLLLALGIVLLNEAIFAAVAIARGHPAPVANLGRFTMLAAMSWMTWQGFAFSRWVLVILVAAAVLTGPGQLLHAWREETPLWAALLTLTVAGYILAGWLLAFDAGVSRAIRHRRILRERDVFRG